MSATKRKASRQTGFTLVETLVAMVVFVVGVMAVSLLILHGIQLQVSSRVATTASAFAKQKAEQLRSLDSDDPQRAIGGDLDSNVADHFDVPPGDASIRRWVVTAGPAGTQSITVAVIPTKPGVRPVQLRVLLTE